MFGETTISYVKIGNHPIETTIYKWLALGFQGHTLSVWEPKKHPKFHQETRFYREIIQMCRSKGYANPQAIMGSHNEMAGNTKEDV